MDNVTVVNKGAEDFTGRFDGKEYPFPVGTPVVVPELVAAFLFGYGKTDADIARALVRNGWHRTSEAGSEFGPEGAKKRLRSFVFKGAAPDPERPKPQPLKLNPQIKSAAQINIPGRSAPLAPSSSTA